MFKSLITYLTKPSGTPVVGVIERIGGCSEGESSSVFYLLLQGQTVVYRVHLRTVKLHEHVAMAQPGDSVQFQAVSDNWVRSFVNNTLKARLG